MKKLILIGGLPGAGKTTIGKAIAKRLSAVYIDKDTISNYFTPALLESFGLPANDRESKTYQSIRPIEYKTTIDVAVENVKMDNDVICTAPFLSDISHPMVFTNKDWLYSLNADIKACNGATLILAWVYAPQDIALRRIIKRGSERDHWKQKNWQSYTENNPYYQPCQFEYPCYYFNNHTDNVNDIDLLVDDFMLHIT